MFERVDAASLAAFRILFGALMFVEVIRYFTHGWVRRDFVETPFHFTYYGFEWLRPLPGAGMYFVFGALGVLALGIMLGWRYRICAVLFAAGFTWIFLIDEAYYLNHFYLIALVSWLMAIVPAQALWSVDARRAPALGADGIPAWALWVLRFQIGAAYFFGGVAKINGDWLRGEPMRMFLVGWYDAPLVGPWLQMHAATLFFAYGGMLFDLLVVFGLLWKPSRRLAVVSLLAFHGMNAWLFQIGIFPAFMAAATILFLEPDWPRRVVAWWRGDKEMTVFAKRPGAVSPAIALGLGLFVAWQCMMPFRMYLYPGNPLWTDQGHRFSWRMKLRIKSCSLQYRIVDKATGETEAYPLPDWLTPQQQHVVPYTPDMVLQLAHWIAADERAKGRENFTVRALCAGSLHGRPPQFLIDPKADLSEIKRSLAPADWIVPLQHPLPSLAQRKLNTEQNFPSGENE